MRSLAIVLLPCALLAAFAQAPAGNRPGVVARLSAHPPLSPEQVAAMETRVQMQPSDVATRLQLLTFYRDAAPQPGYDDPARRAARLQHILYLVEHQPATVNGASALMYVFRSGGPYASAGDHEAAKGAWLRVADTVPAAKLQAARFLFVEDKQEAEELLARVVAAEPANRRPAANLGFFYGLDVLGLDTLTGDVTATLDAAGRTAAAQRARSELDATSNPAVLAGAAFVIQNLWIRLGGGPAGQPELMALASSLMARARELAPPDDPAFRGPMPMVEFFEDAKLGGLEVQRRPGAFASSSAPPSRIRVGGTVQKAKFVSGPDPVYPEQARAAGIIGPVRLNAVIGKDGKIASLTTLSGHPLLVPAALEAVRQWQYQPTLLNGEPVEVATDIVVSFPGP